MSTSTVLRLRGGTTAQHGSFTGEPREVTVDTDENVIVVHDGVTEGGHPAIKSTGKTGAAILPTGTIAQRPSPDIGKIRYNTELNRYEGGYGTEYRALGGGATGGGSDEIFMLNNKVVTQNYTVPSTRNAGTFGPITINDNVTVTIEDGATWTIV